MFRTIHNPQYGVPATPPSRPSPQTPIARPPPSTPPPKGGYGDGGFWRVAQNSQALGRYNGIHMRRNKAAGSGIMPYGNIGSALQSIPAPLLMIGGIFLVVSVYGYLDQKGYV